MTATRADIERWLEEGRDRGASHVIVARDSYDNDNFPLFVMPGQDPRKVYEDRRAEYARNSSGDLFLGADECYDLGMDAAAQLAERRANHWDPHPAPSLPAPR